MMRPGHTYICHASQAQAMPTGAALCCAASMISLPRGWCLSTENACLAPAAAALLVRRDGEYLARGEFGQRGPPTPGGGCQPQAIDRRVILAPHVRPIAPLTACGAALPFAADNNNLNRGVPCPSQNAASQSC